MFDLFRSRDKVVRILLGGILVLVSLSMLTYLVPSFGSGSSASDQVVAEVGGKEITVPMVTKLITALNRSGRATPEVIQRYIPTLLDDLILQYAMAYEAERLGFKVSDDEMRDAIKESIPGLFPDGNFVGVEAYTQLLAQQNMRTSDFEADMRRTLLMTRMRDVALEGTVVTQAEIEQEYRQKNETIKVEYARLTPDKYEAESQPTTEEMQAYYKANGARFQTGEKKNLTIILVDSAKIAANNPPTDSDLQQLYNSNKDAFRTPERVRVRHILFKTTGKSPAEEAKIKAQAEDVLKQLKAGGDFAALAKKYSEDTGSANNPKSPGELPDWVMRKQMVPPFEEAAFSLKPNEISGLVKTEYGYHIVQPLAHEQPRLRSFEEVKPELIAEVQKMRAASFERTAAEQGAAELRKNVAHPELAAAKLAGQLIRADNWTPGTPFPEVGPSPDLEQAISSLKAGEVSMGVSLPGNKVAIALLTGIIPSRQNTFEEVQGQIKSIIARDRAAAAVSKHAEELIAAAKAGDFAKAAKAAGVEAKTSEPFNRAATNVPGIGAATYLADAFGKPEGTVVGPVNLPDGTLVAKVISRTGADLAQLAAQRSQIRDEIKSRKAKDRLTMFEEGIREAMKKAGKIKVHMPVLQRLINSYGSAS